MNDPILAFGNERAIGMLVGEIAIIEYVLSNYEVEPKLESFLLKVVNRAYNVAADILEKPAEDVALIVAGCLERTKT